LILLDTNYRTVPRLLKAGNALLEQVLKRAEYQRYDAKPQSLEPGRKLKKDESEAKCPLEIHLLPAARKENAGTEDEPELIAQRVEKLVAEGVKLSDIAILVRRRSRNAEIARAFARHRLPLVVIGEGGLLQTQEALDCISILRALANPGDDIALLGWLRSPFGGLSDEALMALAPAAHGRTPSLFKRLGEARISATDDVAARARFLQNFGALAGRVGRDAPSVLLAAALENSGAAMAISCGAQAEQRTANLQRMIEVVRELEPRFASLASLSRELVRRVEAEEVEVQGEPEQGGEFVRLMTIHGAKGLEFPVVIVPEIGNLKSGGDNGWLRALPAGDAPLGLHIPWLGEGEQRGKLAPDFEAWRAECEAGERERAEYRRLFYVAFTRARDQLILSGTASKDVHEGVQATWGDQLLGALGCTGFGANSRELEGLSLEWWREIARSQPRSLQPDVKRAEAAQVQGKIELSREIDDTLAAPLPQAAQREGVAPDAVEFGTLVHAELERRILARNRGAKMTRRDGEVGRHADNAEAVLGKLRKARELPEWRMFDGESERRLDLLRSADDEFEIVDFKTDAFDGDPEAFARDRHSEQLREYAGLLRKQLAARRITPKKLRLLVCFTAPGIPDDKRLIEISEQESS
jgi:ATP-dependent exoDNAse (exonuclease V) beta subunit